MSDPEALIIKRVFIGYGTRGAGHHLANFAQKCLGVEREVFAGFPTSLQ